MPKSTNIEVKTRVEAILELLTMGARFRDIREYAAKAEWNVSDSQLRRYQQKALEICEKRLEKDRGRMLALTHMRRELLYARCVEAADYGTALRVDMDRAQLFKLYDTPAPAPKEGGPPPTTAELEQALGRQLVSIEAADLPAVEKARAVASIADAIVRIRTAGDWEKRIEQLAARVHSLTPTNGKPRHA